MKFAIVCASGIGDGLLMQIAAFHLRRLGHDVVTFSNPLLSFANWFPGFEFRPQPENIEETFAPFDAIVLQHDNTIKAKKISSLAKEVHIFYGAHVPSKHGPLRPLLDVQFDRDVCMAENIRRGVETLFSGPTPTLENGLTPPSHLHFGKFEKRIAIHPTSTAEEKNWPKTSFLKLKDKLIKAGLDPIFIAPPEEAPLWNSPLFPTLSSLAEFLYESNCLIGNDSGPGHLASNLGLPTLIIGESLRHLALWRPGWRQGAIAHPPCWTEKTKFTRHNWKRFITVSRVYSQFKNEIAK